MEQTNPLAALEGVGLPQKAAVIYMCLLGKNRMDIAEIARESSVKRATCYEHLEQLLAKDFIVRVPVGKRTYYAANEPEKLLSDFKKRARMFEENVAHMTQMHERATNKPKVTFREGKREMKKIYEELFKTVGDAYSIFPPDVFFETFSLEEYDEFDKEVVEHAMKVRDLFLRSKYNKKITEIRAKNGDTGRSAKILPEWFSSNVDVLIFKDTVALISLRDLSAIVIENKDIADLFKNMHSFMWKTL